MKERHKKVDIIYEYFLNINTFFTLKILAIIVDNSNENTIKDQNLVVFIIRVIVKIYIIYEKNIIK